MKAFTVSFVYSRNMPTGAKNALRCIAVYATNEDEAFGAGYRLTKDEFDKTDGWVLSMGATIEITEFAKSLKEEDATT